MPDGAAARPRRPLRASLQERWLNLRNALLLDPRFHDLARALPVFRNVARHRARALFDVTAGFVYTQITFACVRIGLLEELAGGPSSAERLGAMTDLPPTGVRRLLEAAAVLGLTEALGRDRWALGAQGAALLATSGLREMIAHHALLYADLADPVALLKGTRQARLESFWPYARDAEGEAASYSQLMAATQPMVAREALDAYSLRRRRWVVDVGGGEGAFVLAAAARAPHTRFTVFDLPEVAARARARFAEAGLADRCDAIAGDFRRDPLPRGADTIAIVRVLHDHDDSVAYELLRASHAALAPGGEVAVVEPMSGVRGAERVGEAYFGFYLLAMGSGRPRRRAEIEALAREAGFTRIRGLPTRLPLVASVMIARKT